MDYRDLASDNKGLRLHALERAIKLGASAELLGHLVARDGVESDPECRLLLQQATRVVKARLAALEPAVATAAVAEAATTSTWLAQYEAADAAGRLALLDALAPPQIRELAPRAPELFGAEREPVVAAQWVRLFARQWPATALPVLTARLYEASLSVRIAVLEALILLAPFTLMRDLPRLLTDDDARLRALAVTGLAAIDIDEALKHVERLLLCDDRDRRSAAIGSCMGLDFSRLKPVLFKFFAVENDPQLLARAGLLVAINPDPEVPFRLWELAENAHGDKAMRLKAIMQDACRCIDNAGVLGDGFPQYLERLKNWILQRATTRFVTDCIAQLGDDDTAADEALADAIRRSMQQDHVRAAFVEALQWPLTAAVRQRVTDLLAAPPPAPIAPATLAPVNLPAPPRRRRVDAAPRPGSPPARDMRSATGPPAAPPAEGDARPLPGTGALRAAGEPRMPADTPSATQGSIPLPPAATGAADEPPARRRSDVAAPVCDRVAAVTAEVDAELAADAGGDDAADDGASGPLPTAVPGDGNADAPGATRPVASFVPGGERWIRRLADLQPADRDRATPELAGLVGDPSAPATVRATAFRAAVRLEVPGFVEPARGAVTQSDVALGVAALEYLARYDAIHYIDYLARFLQAFGTRLPPMALRVLRLADPVAALELLAGWLHGNDPKRRSLALAAFVHFDFPLVRDALVEFLARAPSDHALATGLCLFQANPDPENLYLLYRLELAVRPAQAATVRGVRQAMGEALVALGQLTVGQLLQVDGACERRLAAEQKRTSAPTVQPAVRVDAVPLRGTGASRPARASGPPSPPRDGARDNTGPDLPPRRPEAPAVPPADSDGPDLPPRRPDTPRSAAGGGRDRTPERDPAPQAGERRGRRSGSEFDPLAVTPEPEAEASGNPVDQVRHAWQHERAKVIALLVLLALAMLFFRYVVFAEPGSGADPGGVGAYSQTRSAP